MSEYQWYEFVALDRPLSIQQMAELRAVSTRAQITRTRFWNEYQWGDLKADPARLLARYFDAHLYFANWGTHRLMLRLPAAQVDERSLRAYFPGEPVTLTRAGSHVILDLWSETDEPEDDWWQPVSMGELTPLRSSLLAGDLSVAYLAWLLALQCDAVKETTREPPVPVSVAAMSAPLAALAEFLRIDPDLLSAAAEAFGVDDIPPAQRRRSLSTLTARDPDGGSFRAPTRSLGRGRVGADRKHHGPEPGERRTVAELRARAEVCRATREREDANAHAKASAAADAARRRHLGGLAKQGEKVWKKLDQLVDARSYADAVRLTVDLRDLSQRSARLPEFERRLSALKKRHPRRRGYLDAIKRALAGPDAERD